MASVPSLASVGSAQGTVTFQIASDLHLEWVQSGWPGERLIDPVPGADALLLAGDVANLTQVVELFSDWPVPVFMVPGNHEFYGLDMARELERIAQGVYNQGALTVLDNTAVEFKGVRILGATLWTDYRLFPGLSLVEAMAAAQAALAGADHSRIRFDGKVFLPEHALGLHNASRTWLRTQIAQPFAGPTLVMTHHAPSMRSVALKWRGEDSSAAFASEMDLLPFADYWVHGHLHDNSDYTVGRCRVLCNSRGYGRGAAFADNARDMHFENTDFRAEMQLTVPVGDAWVEHARTLPFAVEPRWRLGTPEEASAPDAQAAWSVTDGVLDFACTSESGARWLVKTLNAVERRGLKDAS